MLATIRKILFFVVLASILATAGYYWNAYEQTATYASYEDPTLIPRILAYFQSPDKVVALWTNLLWEAGLAGSSIYIRHVLIAVVVIWAAYFWQWFLNSRGILKGRILYANLPFLIFISAWALIGMTINGVAQTENLYWDAQHSIPGSFDAVTHAITVGMIVGLLQCVDWTEIAGITTRYLDVALDQAASFSIATLIMWYFEYMENADPSRYLGGRNDTYGDILTGYFGGIAVSAAFWLIWALTQLHQKNDPNVFQSD